MVSKLFLLFALLAFSNAGVIIQSDLNGETIQGSPAPVVENTFNYGSHMTLPGAKVIWGSNWNSSPAGETLTFVEYFKPYCSSPITVKASADDAFDL